MSNPRLFDKRFKLDYNTLLALAEYEDKRGEITVCPAGKRSVQTFTHPASISYRGRKSANLRTQGYSKAV